MHGYLSFVSVVRQRSLRRADHSSRGVLPTVVRRCVWSRNLVNEKALANWGGGAVAPDTNTKRKVGGCGLRINNCSRITAANPVNFSLRSPCRLLSLPFMIIYNEVYRVIVFILGLIVI